MEAKGLGSILGKRPQGSVVEADAATDNGEPPAKRLAAIDPFGGLGRDGFMQQRIHRKLHPLAMSLSQEER